MQLFSGKQYLQIDIANNSGYDKLNYDERINKTKELYPEDIIKTATNEQLKELVKINQAEEPELTFAGLMAYRDVLNGIPTGYRVALDSCNSGSQLMSALTRCQSGLNLTGMITNQRMDLYTEVFKRFKQLTGSSEEISRKHLKKAIMTSLYGSKQKPERTLGKHNMEAFNAVMLEMCEGAWTLRQLLLDTWNPHKDVQEWIMPDGFNVVCPVLEKVEYSFKLNDETYTFNVKEQHPTETGLSNVANLVHSVDSLIVREMVRRVKYDKIHCSYVLHLLNQYNFSHEATIPNIEPEHMNTLDLLIAYYEESNFLSVRIVDEIKSIADIGKMSNKHREVLKDTLTKMLSYEPFEIAIIHDSFSCISNNLNYVRYWYNDMIANIVDSDLLQCLLDQISPYKVELDRQLNSRKLLADLVRKSSYGIC